MIEQQTKDTPIFPLSPDQNKPSRYTRTRKIYLNWTHHKRIALVVFLLAVSVFGASVYFLHNSPTQVKNIPENSVLSKANIDLANNRPNTAIAVIHSSSINDKKTLLLLINAYTNTRNYSKAARLYSEYIQRYGASLGLLSATGDAYALAGNKKNAITYFQKVITDYKNLNSPLSNAYITYYQDRIKVLQG
jgi:tetratricopeptide (TPR) repeat protein